MQYGNNENYYYWKDVFSAYERKELVIEKLYKILEKKGQVDDMGCVYIRIRDTKKEEMGHTTQGARKVFNV